MFTKLDVEKQIRYNNDKFAAIEKIKWRLQVERDNISYHG